MKKLSVSSILQKEVLRLLKLKIWFKNSSIPGVLLAGVLLSAGCSGPMVLRSISSTSMDETECSTATFDQTVIPFILDTLRSRQLRRSETFKVRSNYGSINKFVTLFTIRNGDLSKPYMLLFHFADRLEDLRSDRFVTFDFGTDSLVLPVFTDPASTIIGNSADRFLYAFLSDREIRVLVVAETVTGYIGVVDFDLPHSCRELWRNVIGE